MLNVNVRFFGTICLHIHVNGSVWHSYTIVQSFIRAHMVKVRFNICEHVVSSCLGDLK